MSCGKFIDVSAYRGLIPAKAYPKICIFYLLSDSNERHHRTRVRRDRSWKLPGRCGVGVPKKPPAEPPESPSGHVPARSHADGYRYAWLAHRWYSAFSAFWKLYWHW